RATESATETPAVLSVVPGQLVALGYLPEGTDAMAGIHVSELMTQPDSATILRLMRSDRANLGIHRIEELTGLKLEDLDHVVLGLKMHENDLPRLLLVVRTQRPYDLEKIRGALNARGTKGFQDKMLYRVAPEQIQLGGVLWCADERTLVFGLQASDFEGVPATPIAGGDRFPAELQ